MAAGLQPSFPAASSAPPPIAPYAAKLLLDLARAHDNSWCYLEYMSLSLAAEPQAETEVHEWNLSLKQRARVSGCHDREMVTQTVSLVQGSQNLFCLDHAHDA